MATKQGRVSAPELEQFIVHNVRETRVSIGVGAYGSVEEVEIPGALVAAKKLHPQLVTFGSPKQVLKWINDFVAECRLMSQLRHPHIVQFLGVCYLPGSQLPVLLMEKLQTSLDNLLETNPDIPMDIKLFLLTGAGRGVVYLHSRTPSIAHRDLTARNILIDSGLTAKIADLGVAKMVNIKPGQLAATMTRAPGNVLYMPPEAVQEERATRYSTAIDIFSFGVISLFTLTQTFPKDLKPATYFDPSTRRIIGRSEIERRKEYIQLMKTVLGKTHPLVQLTLNCLEYIPEDRPSAVEVLRRLEEVGRSVPRNCKESKLELIQQISAKEDEKNRALTEKEELHLRQLSERNAQLERLQAANDRLQSDVERLQAEKQEQVHGLRELTTLQQQQLEVQRREISELSGQLSSLELGGRALEEGVHQPQGTGQRDVHVPKPRTKPPPRPIVLSSIVFNWRERKDMPLGVRVYSQPVSCHGRLYARGENWGRANVVHKYVPHSYQWYEVPPPPVDNFTIATFRGSLLAVGGRDKSEKVVDTIFTFGDQSHKWIKSLPSLPMKSQCPAVVEYQDHLIVAGGVNSCNSDITDVNILDSSNKWITAESLPTVGIYLSALIHDTIYLVGQDNKTVLRAHVPTLISRSKSGVWESLPNVPLYCSSPVTVASSVLTVGGRAHSSGHSCRPSTSIHLYHPTSNQWREIGHLPEPMFNCHCIQDSGRLFVLGGCEWSSDITSVYTTKLTLIY